MRLLRGQSDPSSQPKPMVRLFAQRQPAAAVVEAEPDGHRELPRQPLLSPTAPTPETPRILGSILVDLMATYTSETIFKCDLPCHTAHLETFPPSQHTHTVPLLSALVSVSTLVLSLK